MTRRHFTTTAFAAASSLMAATDGKMRVAVIGHTGRGTYGHGLDTVWSKIPDLASVVAVADADATGLAAELKKLQLAKGYSDYREMLKTEKPDIVAIGPRHVDQHRDMLLAAINAGAKGIYIEKPFCRTPAEADEIIDAAEKSGCKIAIAHRNRYHPALQTVDRLIADGTLGKILEIRSRGKEDQRGGAEDLWVLGSHLLNIICYFGGKPLTCAATIYQNGKLATKTDVKDGAEGIGLLVGDEVFATWRMERGLNATFASAKGAGDKGAGFGVQLICTKGTIDFRMDKEPIATFLPGNPTGPLQGAREWIAVSTAGIGKPEPITGLGDAVANHSVAARDLIASINENRQPLCSAYDGRTLTEMISAVFSSHIADGARVELPLKERGSPLKAWVS